MSPTLVTTLEEVRGMVRALEAILSREVPIRLALKLRRVHAVLHPEVARADKVQEDILERYVERDGNGHPVPAKDEDGKDRPNAVKLSDPAAFTAAMKELDQAEREEMVLTVPSLVTIEDLEAAWPADSETSPARVPGYIVRDLATLLPDEVPAA